MKLLLFDIDGTLLNTGGAGTLALRNTLTALWGTAGDIDHYDLGGRTIREILRDLLTGAGIDEADIWSRFDEFQEVWPPELARVIGNFDVKRCPGTLELIGALRGREDALLGILTANIEKTAHIKLRTAGFDPADFPVGAYGDVSEVRADLVPDAWRQAEALLGHSILPAETVLIGDTALDVETAHAAGARSVAVMTGGKPREELAAAGPTYLFEDLSDTEEVIAALLG
jgi:phosphoglycolate phosphatase-like HAD superfamily hydrolase